MHSRPHISKNNNKKHITHKNTSTLTVSDLLKKLLKTAPSHSVNATENQNPLLSKNNQEQVKFLSALNDLKVDANCNKDLSAIEKSEKLNNEVRCLLRNLEFDSETITTLTEKVFELQNKNKNTNLKNLPDLFKFFRLLHQQEQPQQLNSNQENLKNFSKMNPNHSENLSGRSHYPKSHSSSSNSHYMTALDENSLQHKYNLPNPTDRSRMYGGAGDYSYNRS